MTTERGDALQAISGHEAGLSPTAENEARPQRGFYLVLSTQSSVLIFRAGGHTMTHSQIALTRAVGAVTLTPAMPGDVRAILDLVRTEIFPL